VCIAQNNTYLRDLKLFDYLQIYTNERTSPALSITRAVLNDDTSGA